MAEQEYELKWEEMKNRLVPSLEAINTLKTSSPEALKAEIAKLINESGEIITSNQLFEIYKKFIIIRKTEAKIGVEAHKITRLFDFEELNNKIIKHKDCFYKIVELGVENIELIYAEQDKKSIEDTNFTIIWGDIIDKDSKNKLSKTLDKENNLRVSGRIANFQKALLIEGNNKVVFLKIVYEPSIERNRIASDFLSKIRKNIRGFSTLTEEINVLNNKLCEVITQAFKSDNVTSLLGSIFRANVLLYIVPKLGEEDNTAGYVSRLTKMVRDPKEHKKQISVSFAADKKDIRIFILFDIVVELEIKYLVSLIIHEFTHIADRFISRSQSARFGRDHTETRYLPLTIRHEAVTRFSEIINNPSMLKMFLDNGLIEQLKNNPIDNFSNLAAVCKTKEGKDISNVPYILGAIMILQLFLKYLFTGKAIENDLTDDVKNIYDMEELLKKPEFKSKALILLNLINNTTDYKKFFALYKKNIKQKIFSDNFFEIIEKHGLNIIEGSDIIIYDLLNKAFSDIDEKTAAGEETEFYKAIKAKAMEINYIDGNDENANTSRWFEAIELVKSDYIKKSYEETLNKVFGYVHTKSKLHEEIQTYADKYKGGNFFAAIPEVRMIYEGKIKKFFDKMPEKKTA